MRILRGNSLLFTGDGGLYIFFVYTLGYANGVLTWEGREWTRSNTVWRNKMHLTHLDRRRWRRVNGHRKVR